MQNLHQSCLPLDSSMWVHDPVTCIPITASQYNSQAENKILDWYPSVN